jgi:hypothetical protein
MEDFLIEKREEDFIRMDKSWMEEFPLD